VFFLFILIPFATFCFIKGIDGEWEVIICSTDWSVASFIIFAQSLGLISSFLSKNQPHITGEEPIFYGKAVSRKK